MGNGCTDRLGGGPKGGKRVLRQVALLGLLYGVSAVGGAELSVGESMRHATRAGETRIGHQESIVEAGNRVRVVQQQASTQVELAGGSKDAHERIEIRHAGTTRYQDWLEFDNPGIYPAAGMTGPVEIELRMQVSVSDATRGIQYHIGLSGRNSSSYSQIILDADHVRTPNTTTAVEAAAAWRVYRFAIYPEAARVQVSVEGEPVGLIQLTGAAADWIRSVNLGFVRLYFRSIQPGRSADGAALEATQLFNIDWIRIRSVGAGVATESKTRNLIELNSRIFSADERGATQLAAGGIVRQGWSELEILEQAAGIQIELANPSGGYHREIVVTVPAQSLTAFRMRYPYVLQTAAIRGSLKVDAKIAVQSPDGVAAARWSMGVRAVSDRTGEVLLSPLQLSIPAQELSAAKVWRDIEFEYAPQQDALTLRLDNRVLATWTPDAETRALLETGNLLNFEWIFQSTAGTGGADQPVRLHIDQMRAFLAHELVTAAEVAAEFARTHSQRTHPRLLFTAADIARAQANIAAGEPVAVKSYQRLISSADAMTTKDGSGNYVQPLRQWELDEGNLRVFNIHRFSEEVGVLGLAWQLTGESAYAQRLWAQIELMNGYPDWGHNRHFLDTGVAMGNYAVALDLIHDYLDSDQRATMLAALKSKGLQPTVNGMRGNTWWSRDPNNWNAIIHGGAIMAGLAFFEDDPTFMADAIALACNGLTPYIDAFYPDGQTEEGFLYWGYGLMYATRAWEALQQGLGTDFGLSDSVGIRNTRNFPLLVTGPVATLNVGDDGIQSSRVAPNWWLARRFGDANQMQSLRERWTSGNGTEWLNFAWYDPALASGGPVGLESKDNYLRGLELVSHVQSWEEPDALYIAAHGGDNAASHGHLDAGSFYLQGAGQILAYGNLGPDNYNSPGFFNNDTRPAYMDVSNLTVQQNAGRWHFYNLRAEGKNALVFKPRGQRGDIRPDQDPHGLAIVEQQFSSLRRGFSIMNLSNVYHRDVTHYRRGIMLSADRRVATVQDEFTSRQNATVWWNLHHGANVVILEDNGRAARIFVGGSPRFRARILQPESARFSEMRQLDYLAGESGYPLTRNDRIPRNIRKLMIELDTDAGVATTIAVQFTVDPAGFPDIAGFQPIADWHNEILAICPPPGHSTHLLLSNLEHFGSCWAHWSNASGADLGFVNLGMEKSSGWIYHDQIGWMYPFSGSMDNHLFIYSSELGWLVTGFAYSASYYHYNSQSFFSWRN